MGCEQYAPLPPKSASSSSFSNPTTSSHLIQPVKKDLPSQGTMAQLSPLGYQQGNEAVRSCEEWDPSISHHRAPGPVCTASSTYNLGERTYCAGKPEPGSSAALGLLLVDVTKL